MSQIPSSVWDREVPPESRYSFIHTHEPVQADAHIVYGLRRPLSIPNSPHRIVFIASEPPEIREYNLRVLSRYGTVAGPKFSYLQGLNGFQPIEAIAPWWVGTTAGGEHHYDLVTAPAKLSRADLEVGCLPTEERISAIVSNKARTPLQQQRLRLVDYLIRHLPSFEAFGVEHQRVEDKSEVLARFRYHLAVENSSHEAYWTEKLADPILMDNYVFYFGDPMVAERFDSSSIHLVDPWNPESTYAALSQALESDAWKGSASGRQVNRRKLLDQLSFHRAIESVLDDLFCSEKVNRVTKIPAHNPRSKIKPIFDPVYRLVNRRRFPSDEKQ